MQILRRTRRDRAKLVADRAAKESAFGLPQRCLILGCGRLTMRASGKGLAPHYCRRHIEHRARHGSIWHSTYRAAELKPYRDAAGKWIDANESDFRVASALKALEISLNFSGPAERPTRLRGMSPRDRARVALARLGAAGIAASRILEIHLAVAALIEEDPGSHRTREFRLVQTAKAAHRLASGWHRKWDMPRGDGRTVAFELHAFPRSSGRVLRHLGEMIEASCEIVTFYHSADVMCLKLARHGKHPALTV